VDAVSYSRLTLGEKEVFGVSAHPDAFVGRAAELASLRDLLEQARAGKPRVALLLGPGGIGKTALVRRFVQEAADLGVFRVTADEAETNVAYGLVAQLVAGVRRSLLRETPGLRTGPLPTADPLVVGAELASMLTGAQASQPVSLVLEDLHWADRASSEAFLLTIRRLRAERLLIIVSYRPQEMGRLAGRWERLAVSDERCRQIPLTGLDAQEVIDLARVLQHDDMPRALAERMVDHTEGNPLYIRSLLRELPPGSLPQSAELLPAPRSLAEAILTTLQALPAAAQELVIAAAVLGRTCSLAAAARLSHVGDPLKALEAAQHVNLLAEDPWGRRQVTFPHPLIHAAVYGSLGPAQRRALHRDAAQLVEGGKAALSHRVAATVGADAHLAEALERAADHEASRGDFPRAAAHCELAAEFSVDSLMRQRRQIRSVELMLQGGDVLGASMRRASVESCRVTSARQLVLGWLAFLRGQPVETEQFLREAWETRNWERASETAITTALQLGEFYIVVGRSAEAELLLRTACRESPAYAAHHHDLMAERAAAMAVQGRGLEGLRLLKGVLRQSVPSCRPEELDAMTIQAMVRLWTGQLSNARADLNAIVKRAHDGLSGPRFTQAVAYLGETEYHLGHWDESIRHLEVAVSGAHDSERVWAYPFVHSLAALPRIGRGEWAAAQAHVDEAVEAANAFPTAGTWAYAAAAAATLAWARGNPEQVLSELAVLHGREGGGIGEPGILQYDAPRISAMVSLGRFDEAEVALADLERRAHDRRLSSTLLDCMRLHGVLEAARDRPEAATAAFTLGTRAAPSVPVPLSRALFGLEYGRFLRGQGQRREAIAELRAARAVAAGLGARPLLSDIDEELRESGLTRGGRARQAPLELTQQELRVALLVAVGRSNRQVAGELFISEKTVEYHLARIYNKLGIASRAELSAALARREEGH
jgi:ATP/maltotriose-dependent transcriptional regulator MalT